MTDPIVLLERFMLALAVYKEARGESLYGKALVAGVIHNRVADPRWPDSYRDVVLQPWQFSAFNKSDPNVAVFPKADEAAWQDSVAAADLVMSAETPITNANHYHVVGLSPNWRDDTKIVATEGRHVFYRL